MSDFWDDEPDFEGSDGATWRRTERGSFVRIEGGELTATVFERALGWGGVSNSYTNARFTLGQRDTPEEAIELLLEAEAEGEGSNLWAPSLSDWRASKPRAGRPGYWCRRAGTVLSVRQCEPRGGYPPSWFASINAGEPVLNADGKPWFRDAEAAMMAAEAASTGDEDDGGY